jgi:nucleoside-diphosphate kinase
VRIEGGRDDDREVMERTFVMIKPDAFGRRLCGEIIRRYECKGLKLVGMKMQVISRDLAERHYAEHRERPFFKDLVGFITSGPTVQMVWEGKNAVAVVRKLNGATNSQEADFGTIRGDFGMSVQNNLVHASDALDTAHREIAIYFQPEELWNHTMPDDAWLSE